MSLFHAESRRAGKEFQGQVTSTLKPLESQCIKDDVFINTFHQTKSYTDQWGNLNFIISMKKLTSDEASPPSASSSSSVASTSATSPSSSASSSASSTVSSGSS